MSAAARKRRYRERQRAGLAVLPIPADPVHVAAVLVDAGYLSPHADDDPADLVEPLARLIADLKVRDLVR